MDISGLQGHAAASYRWQRSRLSDDGRWRSDPGQIVDAYCKAPWSFAAAGDRQAAQRCLSYLERNYISSAGDLEHIDNKHQRGRFTLYPHAYVAIGSIMAGRTELTNRCLDFLDRYRHAELGAWGDRDDGQNPRRYDSISTSAIGLAFLEAGRMEAAYSAAYFLERLLELQAGGESIFFTSVLGSGELLTAGSKMDALKGVQVDLTGRFQTWWAIGFPVIFLGRLLEVTEDERWLHIARRYLKLLDHSAQAWDDLSSGKLAWGCAIIYRATGDPVYKKLALRAARALVSRLGSDGGWHACRKGEGQTGGSPNAIGFGVSTEITLWLALTGEALALRDGASWIPPARYGDENTRDRWQRQCERFLLQRAWIARFRYSRF